MRGPFLDALLNLGEENPNLMLLTADLGFGLFEPFIERFPTQFLNVGVAEQNMIGVAAGLALEGHEVLVYSITNFATFRCLEQIRNDACYHQLNINIIASGGGFSYGALGMSHHATEDLSILRALPGITLFTPSTDAEVTWATSEMVKTPGVAYLRLEKKSAKSDLSSVLYRVGQAQCVREGGDVALLCMGSILDEACIAADQLANQGVSVRVVNFPTFFPFDGDEIRYCAREIGAILTLEEHSVVGGLGTAVAEFCMDNGLSLQFFKRLGLQHQFSKIVGDRDYLLNCYEMNAAAVVSAVLGWKSTT